MRAMIEAAESALSPRGIKPLGVEGKGGNLWVLVDYNDVILHIFRKEAREFYNLDRLWGDAPQIAFPAVSKQTVSPAKKKKKG